LITSTSRLRNSLNQLQQEQAFDNIQLQSLQVIQQQRQTWETTGLFSGSNTKISAKTAIASNKSALFKRGSFSYREILSQEAEILAGMPNTKVCK